MKSGGAGSRIRYYNRRGGLPYLLGDAAFLTHMISAEKFRSSDFINHKFYQYFVDLPRERYKEELQEQLQVLFTEPDIRSISLDYPATFNDKIQWLKLYDADPVKTELSDKYRVRKWIAEKIGEQYLIPLAGGPWESASEIDFSSLPDQFALKANHGSGMNWIVKNKKETDLALVRRAADAWMHTLFGWVGLESQYFTIPRRLYAEQYLEEAGDLLDYKVFCYDGKPEYVQVIGGRDLVHHTGYQAFFDTEWNRVPISNTGYPDYPEDPVKPDCLPELLDVARILSEGFRFVRVDLYAVGGKVRFGEMTFTPGGGFLLWRTREAAVRIGKDIRI